DGGGGEEPRQRAVVRRRHDGCAGEESARDALQMTAGVDPETDRRTIELADVARHARAREHDGAGFDDRAGERRVDRSLGTDRDAAHGDVEASRREIAPELRPAEADELQAESGVPCEPSRDLDVESVERTVALDAERRVVTARP